MTQHDSTRIGIEAVRIANYLVGVDPPAILIERYVAANEVIFVDPVSEEDRQVLDFIDRRPWSMPFLESALGLVRPASRLRRKIIVMMAILETSPEFSCRFDPQSTTPIGLLIACARHGLTSILKVGIGLVFYLFLKVRG